MKIILKYIITNVKERKLRSGVMLLSILLSTTLLFVSFSIGASYENAQKKMARGWLGAQHCPYPHRPVLSLPRTFRICQPLERRLAY